MVELKEDPNPSIPAGVKNYVPQIRTREIESIMRVNNGEVAVLGGLMEDDLVVPIRAEPGSLVVFPGNTWHCTYPKTSAGVRTHIVTAFGRNFVASGEDYSDVPDSVIAHGGAEFARLVGRRNWQGYGRAGPKLEDIGAVRAAYQTQYG